ncbi:hypothetical protein [Deinococcus sp.]|uniref:hypothetical protein n=1 Tax=Deinococcus sp. TaxID=47478 RepID=UPI0026012911|nr:hypothetical protein [Deinococcus sp.]
MPLIDPPQTTVDLSKTVPGGWTLVGFSEPRSDGVNPFRVPQPVTEIRFSTPGPRYVELNYQLFSPRADVRAKATLDGQALGQFTFPAGQFVTFKPSGFVRAGPHLLRFEQGCAVACAINQYNAQAKLVVSARPTARVGSGATRWAINAPQSAIQTPGFAPLTFDGQNYFRSLTSPGQAKVVLPSGTVPTSLHYVSVSDTGAYRLAWSNETGRAVETRLPKAAIWAPKNALSAQDLSLVGDEAQTLKVQVKCQDGTAACLPVRLYWSELTGVSQSAGLGKLSLPTSLGTLLLAPGLLALFALLLRPARARR